MARMKSAYAPAYELGDLKFATLQGAFADKPHDVYVVYDEAMDQILVRLVDPTIPASEYFISDDTAFLVREDNQEVAGYTIVNFLSDFLPKAPQLNEMWIKYRLAEDFKEYRKLRYEPEARKIKEPVQRDRQRIVTYAALKSKAAAVLVAA
jgi:hypothetical protein